MKKSCENCKWLTCEDSEICEIGIDANECINWQESELSKCQRKASEYFERSKAKTNEIVLLKRKLSDNTETINTERMKVDMLKRKLEIAVKALEHYAGEPFDTNDIYLDIFDLIKHCGAVTEFDSDTFALRARQALEKINDTEKV